MKIKNLFIGIAVLLIVAATAAFVTYSQSAQGENGQPVSASSVFKGKNNADYLRIHVRANSNEQIDQDVKYKVKDEIVKFITPYAAECTDKQTAMNVIGGVLGEIEKVADGVLKENGFNYTSRASVRAEEFPTRVYGDATLEAGIYDALIVELGSGTGDNWWCVIYPPLCFTAGTAQVQYRSAIYDIISSFFGKK
ncbi:MAG: stage II sporulation protein R [Clostridia bacterium]|nr:stage II sporulation protein R [Clostridia bacterium]